MPGRLKMSRGWFFPGRRWYNEQMRKFLPVTLVFLALLGAAPVAPALDEDGREQLRGLRDWYPLQACRADRELGQCFKWSVRDCEAKSQKSLDACLKRHDRQLRGSASGDLEHWQRRILTCVFDDLKAKNPKLHLGGPLCEIGGGAE